MRHPETNETAGAATLTVSMNPTVQKDFTMNMPANPEDFNTLVTPALKTTSRIIAEKFEKSHNHVMRDIRNLIDANPDWGASNFGQTPYVDPQNGQTYQMYEMTRDGYSMLVMGFTGKKALDWKIKFLAAFNAMEAQLRSHTQAAQIDLNDPAQLVPLLTSYAQRTQIAEAKVIELAPKAEAFDVLDASEGAVCLRIAAKVLGAAEKKFAKWLEANRWLFRQNGIGPWQGYADKRVAGYLEHRPHTFLDRTTGENRTTAQVMFTPKGLARLAAIFAKEGVPA